MSVNTRSADRYATVIVKMEASLLIFRIMRDVRACAACLATGVRMCSMSVGGLLRAFQLITGRQTGDEMPRKLCWECAALVNKFSLFRLKCDRAHLLLQDIYSAQHDLSEENISSVDRNEHNLNSLYTFSDTLKYDLKSCNVITVKFRRKRKNKLKDRTEQFTPTESVSCDATEPFIKVELDIKKEQEETELKSETEFDNDMPLASFHSDNLDSKPGDEEPKKRVRKTRERPTKEKKVTRKRAKGEIKAKRERKTPKVKAKDFGMREDLLSQEQQLLVIQERQKAEGFSSSRFKCNHCYKAFNEEKAFKNHMLLHDPVSGELVCDVCKIRYKTRNKLCKHISTHHMKKYSCKLCITVFYNRSSALKHFAWHKGVVYTCHICGASFDKKTSHQNHLRIKHPSEHVCGDCGEAFVSKMGLLQHGNKMHSLKMDTGVAADGGARRCAACRVQFTSAAAWTRHVLISPKHEHEREALCPLGCEVCGATAADGAALRAHRATHRRSRGADLAAPITCEICGEAMASSRTYHAHFRRQHPDKTRTHYPGMRAPCMCELCGKVFQDKVHLKLHSYTHTGERPFKCDTCNKRFTTPDVLRIHIRSHTKELPYKCDICGQGFSNGANMNRHKVVHTDAKPYSCATCGKCFKYRTTVKSHTEFVHMKKPWPKRDRSRREDKRPRAQPDQLAFMQAHA